MRDKRTYMAAATVWDLLVNGEKPTVSTVVERLLETAPHAGHDRLMHDIQEASSTLDDLWRFTTKPKSRAEHYARQVLSTVNFPTGTDAIDFAHLWLNYQVEHHLYPDLPMRKYQEAQPKVQAICEKYGVPYVQESVFKRVKKLVDIMVGNTTMKMA